MRTDLRIDMSRDEMHAIREGHKYQFRMPVLPAPRHRPFQVHGDLSEDWYNEDTRPNRRRMMSMRWKCPYGNPGNVLVAICDADSVRLEVAEVRIERLTEISEADCFAEGVALAPLFIGVNGAGDPIENEFADLDPWDHVADRWDKRHGLGSWNTNPWVWVITFRQQPPPATGEEG